MLSAPFAPTGQLYFVGTAAVQVPTIVSPNSPTGLDQNNSYRIRNLSGSTQYLSWGTDNTVTSQGAPSQGDPSPNTIGMLANSVEVFGYSIPINAWFIASSATGFEIIPGTGS